MVMRRPFGGAGKIFDVVTASATGAFVEFRNESA